MGIELEPHELLEVFGDDDPTHHAAEASGLAEEHRRSIEAYYDCSPETHRGLGRMYIDDERLTAHYDRRAPGLAAWLHEAIEAAYELPEA